MFFLLKYRDLERSPKNLRWITGGSSQLWSMSISDPRFCSRAVLANRKYPQKQNKKERGNRMKTLIVGIFPLTKVLGDSVYNQ